MVFPNSEQFPTQSPSQDYSDRFEDDRVLRRHGYRVVERQNGCEAVWEKNGKRYTKSEALVMIRRGT